MSSYLSLGRKGSAVAEEYLGISKSNRLAIGVLLSDGSEGFYTSDGVDESSLFDIGSISKTFTAQAILKLEGEKKLSLLDTVDKFIPLPAGRYPTLEMLLTHTAHYGYLTPIEITLPSLIRKSYSRANVYRGIGEPDVIRALIRRGARKESCAGYSYSDFAYALLGITASRITGKSITALLGDIVDGYGMDDTSVLPADNRVECRLFGKVIPPWRWEEDNPYIASGGISSSIRDMTAYAGAQVKRLYPYTARAQNRYEKSFGNASVGTCLGWHTYKKSNQCWHVGGVGTFRSSMIFNTRLGCAVVVLGNAKGKRSANVHYLAKLLYSEIKRRHVKIIE